jgi:hypothetical protein
MSFFRFYRDKKDADGVPLYWPGGPEGFPFRGPQPPMTTANEYNNLKLSGKPRCRTFYLAKEDDAREYITIRDRCVNGLYLQVDRERTWDPETKNYRIFLEWVELAYDTAPPTSGGTDAVREYKKESAGITIPVGKLAGFRKDW